MTEITTTIESAVEGSNLPRRLKDDLYRAIEARDVTEDEAKEILRATVAQYEQSRVDPLDPVGTVSAQSIGEPGTQMSVASDERVLIRDETGTHVTEIGPFIDRLLADRPVRTIADHEVAQAPEGVEVLSLRSDEQVAWKPVEEISRHESPEQLLEIELKSGRTIQATKNHSFVTRKNNEVVPVAGDELGVGDWLPVVASFEGTNTTEIPLREYLPVSEYWHTSLLTDGGVKTVSEDVETVSGDGERVSVGGHGDVESIPVGSDQLRNKKQALADGRLEQNAVYPRGGTVSLPEQFPLDAETGFFIGAFLAEGSVTDYYVSISNTDEAFQQRIRAFAERFGLSVNEYENTSGFATGYDIRINGAVLADFLRQCCVVAGNKAVPEFAFGADEEFVSGLLSGYFSGDGNVSKSAVRASSTSERLIVDIALLLARVGVYATRNEQGDSATLRVPSKHVRRFHERVGIVGQRGETLAELAATVNPDGPDATDQIPNFGSALKSLAADAGLPSREVNAAHNRQRIGRNRLVRLLDSLSDDVDTSSEAFERLSAAVSGDVVWDRISSIETVSPDCEYVYDFSVEGLETFTTAEGVITHNTMNTFHYAGVAEIDVTQGLPRLIELVDARKEPDTPMMTVYLEDEYATDRERAHEVVWKIEATRILQLGDVSTNVGDMLVQIALNEETLRERWPTVDDPIEVAEEIAETIESALGVTARQDGLAIEFGPEEPSYRDLLQLVEELREIVFKGIEEISRVVIRKEETDEGEEFILYTEGSDFGTALNIEGVDASRTTCNNIHEIHKQLGIEAAREAIIEETMNTLEEQGLGDVNVRHLMLVSDIMTNEGTIESIGRHGISGAKDSVLARAAFEVTVNHLLDAAVHGEVDELDGVTENVIVGKPIKLGTGDVELRMSSGTQD